MQPDMTQGRMMKAVQKLAALIGIGVVCVDDPDYTELIEAYKKISVAHRKADYTTVLTTLDRDYFMVTMNQDRIKRPEVEEQLRKRFEDQVKTDYREEPAHFVIRGNRAQIASQDDVQSIHVHQSSLHSKNSARRAKLRYFCDTIGLT